MTRSGRLSRSEVAKLPTSTLTEAQFQQQITELAELRGWEWFHVRPGRTADSWRTPTSGTMAKGWPDLFLIRGRRIIFMEVKRAGGMASPEQDRVQAVLHEAAEAYIVQPHHWDFIESELT